MITGNLHFNQPFEAYRLSVIRPAMGKKLIAEKKENADAPLCAYVNHGRWLVKCECGGAEYAWEEKLFMCQSCFNAGHKHLYRPVIFPSQREAIEKLLITRPLNHRHWKPGETLADLRHENEIHAAELL